VPIRFEGGGHAAEGTGVVELVSYFAEWDGNRAVTTVLGDGPLIAMITPPTEYHTDREEDR
jgi:hypothetical protein